MNDKTKNIDPGVKDLIINTAYGSAGYWEKLKAKRLISSNPELKELFNEYKQTADSVHSLNKEVMPDSVLHNAETITETRLSKKENSFLDDLISVFYAKPQVTFIATAVVMGMLIFAVFTKNNNAIDYDSIPYTKQEVERANRQAKQALMLVSQVLNTTSSTVTEQIIPNRVVKPINESFEYINNLFKEGDI